MQQAEPKSCDTMVATPSATHHGQTIFAKNSDRPWNECQPLELHPQQEHAAGTQTGTQFVAVPQVRTTWRHVGSRPWWCWGYEHGFNEHQVVIGNEGLASKLEPADTPRLIGMEIVRLGLERGQTARQAVQVMTQLITQYGQGKFENQAGVRTYDNGYIVADPSEAFVIETAGHAWAVKRVDGALGISNVYSVETDYQEIAPCAEEVAREHGWAGEGEAFNFAKAYARLSRTEGSGAMRRQRSCAVLGGLSGAIGVETMMAVLRDHSDGNAPEEPFQTGINPGHGICVHFNRQPDGAISGGNTAASLVADLCADGSRLPVYWCGFYSPCLAPFFPVFLEASLPAVLARGGERPDSVPDSPWWAFQRLNALARQGGEEAISLMRQRWAGLESEWMASAYALAGEGKRLLDAGRTIQAEELLSQYLHNNVVQMLDALGPLEGLVGQGGNFCADSASQTVSSRTA